MRISDWSSDVCSSDLVKIVLVAAHDAHVDELAGPQAGVAAILDLDQAIDLRCVGHRARDRQLAVDRVDDAAPHAANPGFEPGGGDVRLPLHEARQPLLLHVRSDEHTSELQSLMRISYAVFCFKKTNI